MYTCTLGCDYSEELDEVIYLDLIDELLKEIQTLRKDIVTQRIRINELTPDRRKPFPFPVSDLPGMGAIYCDHQAMRRYEKYYGEHLPEY